MKANKRWPWKNVEPKPDPMCVQCGYAKSKHIVLNCTDGVSLSAFTFLCPGLTFMSRADSRVRREMTTPCMTLGKKPTAK